MDTCLIDTKKIDMNDLIVPYPEPIRIKKKEISEKDVEWAVCEFAVSIGWMHRKFVSPAHRSVPDRIFINKNGFIVFIEFKRPGEGPTDKQWREIRRLRNNNAEVQVVDNVELGKRVINFFTERYLWQGTYGEQLL